jgi:hypothetical protein
MFTKSSKYLLAGLNLLAAACSTVSVTTDYDRATSFDQYRTYTLTPSPTPTLPLSPSGENALRDSLRQNLAAHGLSEVPKDADLHVVPHVSTKERVVVHHSGDWAYRGHPYAYGRYMTDPLLVQDISQYTEGSLILDFVDAKTQKLVFRGAGTAIVSDPKTNAERIREAVEKIVQEFPKAALH